MQFAVFFATCNKSAVQLAVQLARFARQVAPEICTASCTANQDTTRTNAGKSDRVEAGTTTTGGATNQVDNTQKMSAQLEKREALTFGTGTF